MVDEGSERGERGGSEGHNGDSAAVVKVEEEEGDWEGACEW